MKTLKEKFDKGYNIDTYKSIINGKGKRFFVEESSSLEKIEELQLKIMLDVKEAVLEFENVLKRSINDNCLTITTKDTLDVFKEIFGDFEQ